MSRHGKHGKRGRLVKAAVTAMACAALTGTASAMTVMGTYSVSVTSWEPMSETQPARDRGTARVKPRRITIREQGLDGVISRIILEPQTPISNGVDVQRFKAKGTSVVTDLATGQKAWGTLAARIKIVNEANQVLIKGKWHIVGDRGFWDRGIEDGKFRGIKRK
ncbi:MAG: hypothetical protein ACYTGF_14930 [Planctomycetota bacterium]